MKNKEGNGPHQRRIFSAIRHEHGVGPQNWSISVLVKAEQKKECIRSE
jgi:hypothetical protein